MQFPHRNRDIPGHTSYLDALPHMHAGACAHVLKQTERGENSPADWILHTCSSLFRTKLTSLSVLDKIDLYSGCDTIVDQI